MRFSCSLAQQIYAMPVCHHSVLQCFMSVWGARKICNLHRRTFDSQGPSAAPAAPPSSSRRAPRSQPAAPTSQPAAMLNDSSDSEWATQLLRRPAQRWATLDHKLCKAVLSSADGFVVLLAAGQTNHCLYAWITDIRLCTHPMVGDYQHTAPKHAVDLRLNSKESCTPW